MSCRVLPGISSTDAMMNRSRNMYTFPGETGQNLFRISATTSVPPVLPPRLKIQLMPMASSKPPMIGTSTFSLI